MQSSGERLTRQMKSARAFIADGGLNPELQVTLPGMFLAAAHSRARVTAR